MFHNIKKFFLVPSLLVIFSPLALISCNQNEEESPVVSRVNVWIDPQSINYVAEHSDLTNLTINNNGETISDAAITINWSNKDSLLAQDNYFWSNFKWKLLPKNNSSNIEIFPTKIENNKIEFLNLWDKVWELVVNIDFDLNMNVEITQDENGNNIYYHYEWKTATDTKSSLWYTLEEITIVNLTPESEIADE